MRRVLLVLLLAVILLPLASAETYRISGRATYADGSAVQLDYVSVQCEQAQFDCYQYRGTNVLTDAYGDFTIVIDADAEEDELDILLALRGETFLHTIDISAHEASSEGETLPRHSIGTKSTSIWRIHGLWLFSCPLCFGVSSPSCCEPVVAFQPPKVVGSLQDFDQLECWNVRNARSQSSNMN